MKILELFAGSRSIGKAGEELGHIIYSSDIEQFGGIHYVCNILDFDISKLPFIPDVIRASPPCTGFSVAAIGHNRTGGKEAYIPKSDTARLGIELVKKTLDIIDQLKPKYWFIENPRGLLRKMPFMQGLYKHTVTYCQYGDNRMKPTDIWTNNYIRKPKIACKNGMPCHVAAPRGSRTGTQGLKGAYERSKIPHELCLEIIRSCMCDKVGYPSEKMAREKLNKIKKQRRLTSHIPKRCYYCTICGLYHLTKSTIYIPRNKYLDNNS